MMPKNQVCCSNLVIVALRRKGIMNALCLFLLLFFATTIAMPQPLSSPTRIVPDDPWVRIFFGSIDELTGRLGFKPLLSTELQPGDVELRVWSSFGLGATRGYIIKKAGNTWSAVSMVDPRGTIKINGRTVEPSFNKVLNITDWSVIWEKLERAGIADIRDDSEIPGSGGVEDGISYVVEIAKAGYYRTYMLDNPEIQRSEDGDKLLRILSIISAAFIKTSPVDSAIPSNGVITIQCASKDAPSQPLSPQSPEWTYAPGTFSKNLPESQLSAEKALAQAITLNDPKCEDLPSGARFMPASGDIGIEILIKPDGAVAAARSVYGPSRTQWMVNKVLKWLFVRSDDQDHFRRTVVTIRFVPQQPLIPLPN
jgi:hypothetical protein